MDYKKIRGKLGYGICGAVVGVCRTGGYHEVDCPWRKHRTKGLQRHNGAFAEVTSMLEKPCGEVPIPRFVASLKCRMIGFMKKGLSSDDGA
jgi:hypothetical protein